MSVYAHIASVLGSKKNIMIGMVGSLAKGIKPGDFILSQKILGNDNSLKYIPENLDKFFYPDKVLYNKLKQRFPDNLKLWEGNTITCEVMLAETKEDVANWSKSGFLGVEMEGAMVFALSRHFDIPSAAIYSVSDNLIENETMLNESYELSKKQRDNAIGMQYNIVVKELLDIPG